MIFKRYTNAETMVQDLKQGVIDFAESVPVDLFADPAGHARHRARTSAARSRSRSSASTSATSRRPARTAPVTPRSRTRRCVKRWRWRSTRPDSSIASSAGYGTVGSTIVVPTVPFWHLDPDPAIPFDIARGERRCWSGAGYTDSDGDGIRNMPGGGENLDFRFIVRTESPDAIQAGKLIAGWFKQIGIGTETIAVTDSKLIDSWLRESTTTCTSGDGVPTPTRTSSCRRSPPISAACGATPATRTPTTTSCTRTSRPRRLRTSAS